MFKSATSLQAFPSSIWVRLSMGWPTTSRSTVHMHGHARRGPRALAVRLLSCTLLYTSRVYRNPQSRSRCKSGSIQIHTNRWQPFRIEFKFEFEPTDRVYWAQLSPGSLTDTKCPINKIDCLGHILKTIKIQISFLNIQAIQITFAYPFHFSITILLRTSRFSRLSSKVQVANVEALYLEYKFAVFHLHIIYRIWLGQIVYLSIV